MSRQLYTGPTAEDLDRIPADLKARPQWVLWRGADRVNEQTGEIKLNKVPIDPQTLHNADTTDPTTWGPFEQCVAALNVALEGWEQDDPSAYRGGGIGYVFTSDDPYTGVDLDHCRDPDTGALSDWAQPYIDALASYTEVTPSQSGVHILVQGALPPTGRRKGAVEIYDYARFFTMTGWHLAGTPSTIEARHEALTAFHSAIFGAPQSTRAGNPAPQASSTPLLDDTVLLDKARAASNGAKFTPLWSGDIIGYDSPSNADLALCVRLAFWTQDTAQIDRLFRQSGLRRDKWDEKRGAQTYGERTIAEALARQTEHYTPHDGARRRVHSSAQDASVADTGASGARDDGPLPWSDYTNALALVRNYGQDLRYCFPWHTWLTWTGTHWQRDTSGAVMRAAKQTVKRLARHAADLDDEKAKALMGHVKKSLSAAALKAMIELTRDEPGIPVQPEDLDTNPWLLNCTNETLDLKTGTLQAHRQADLLTQCLSVGYDREALCPTWERFLWRVMGGTVTPDSEEESAAVLEARTVADDRAKRLIGFLQHAIGYSLTGETREQCLFVLHGSGDNGKSTFLEVLQTLLGDYAQSTPSASLLAKDRDDGIPNDIARLRGARLVTTVEIGEGKQLNEELIKRLTGQDTITARFLHAEFFDFRAEFKLFIACNHLPTIRGTDHAIWRRIRLIPFQVTIPEDEKDQDLPAKLRAELPGILRWAVQGCLAWQKDGLGTPEEVKEATKDYRASMDVFEGFLAEECYRLPGAQVKASELYDAYERWCKANDVEALNKRTFGLRLSDSGFTPDKGTAGTRIWKGIGLPAKEDDSKRSGA